MATLSTLPGSSAPPNPAGVQAHRVIFIDLGRALAITFMVYGHTVSALLAPEYQAGLWFEVWTFQRGLTSSLFLLLAGFAFSIATSRHWTSHLQWSPALARRVRRFLLFVALGYALHFPVGRLSDLATLDDARWRSFLMVDVLQLIGVTFLGVQLLVMAVRTRRAFTGAAFALAVAVVLATPLVWRVDATRVLPLWLAAYLTPDVGSLFPLFPWMAFVLLGAGLGQVYSHWGAAHLSAYASRALLLPGAAMVAAALALRALPAGTFGAGPGALVPAEFVLRAGASLVVLAAIAYLSRRLTRLPHLFGAVAQESLLIYFVHLCIVYGSIWNVGLSRWYGASLNPAQTLLCVVVLLASMAALASYWNWWKHVRPRAAHWTSFGVGGLLLGGLLT